MHTRDTFQLVKLINLVWTRSYIHSLILVFRLLKFLFLPPPLPPTNEENITKVSPKSSRWCRIYEPAEAARALASHSSGVISSRRQSYGQTVWWEMGVRWRGHTNFCSLSIVLRRCWVRLFHSPSFNLMLSPILQPCTKATSLWTLTRHALFIA